MMRGLVIGKFMPVHNGHIALIRFAASQCEGREKANDISSQNCVATIPISVWKLKMFASYNENLQLYGSVNIFL